MGWLSCHIWVGGRWPFDVIWIKVVGHWSTPLFSAVTTAMIGVAGSVVDTECYSRFNSCWEDKFGGSFGHRKIGTFTVVASTKCRGRGWEYPLGSVWFRRGAETMGCNPREAWFRPRVGPSLHPPNGIGRWADFRSPSFGPKVSQSFSNRPYIEQIEEDR